jgi:hypothetical protein
MWWVLGWALGVGGIMVFMSVNKKEEPQRVPVAVKVKPVACGGCDASWCDGEKADRCTYALAHRRELAAREPELFE